VNSLAVAFKLNLFKTMHLFKTHLLKIHLFKKD